MTLEMFHNQNNDLIRLLSSKEDKNRIKKRIYNLKDLIESLWKAFQAGRIEVDEEVLTKTMYLFYSKELPNINLDDEDEVLSVIKRLELARTITKVLINPAMKDFNINVSKVSEQGCDHNK